MVNLEHFFKNHFESDKIGDANLAKFVEIHIQNLIAANTDGRYNVMIEGTTAKYEIFADTLSSKDVKFAVQQSLTKSKDSLVEEFVKKISQKEGLIRSIWGVDSPTYQEFFPLGLSEYHKASLKNISMLMNRIINAATEHVDDIGQPFVDLFSMMRSNFTAARNAQLEKKGEVSDTRSEKNENRSVLEIELMKNLLALAAEYSGRPEKCTDFFDQSFID